MTGALATAAESSISWSITPEARYDDNIGLAPDSASKRDDVTLRLAGSVIWQPIKTVTDETTVSLTPFYDGVQSLTDLSNYGATLALTHLHQFGNSFTAPWIEVHADGTILEYEGSELRDGYKGEGRVTLGKRFSPLFTASLGYRYQWRRTTNDNPEGTLPNGNSNKVFHQDRDGPFVRLDLSPTPKTLLFFQYDFLQGDVASTADPRNFENGFLFARARDFAFEEGSRFLVWRIDADQNIYNLGLEQVLTDRLILKVGTAYLKAKTSSGNDYENFVVNAALAVNF
jgi:hypothetical protein